MNEAAPPPVPDKTRVITSLSEFISEDDRFGRKGTCVGQDRDALAFSKCLHNASNLHNLIDVKISYLNLSVF